MFKIIGFQHQDINFKDGRQVTGWKIYCIEQRDKVTGYACESFFLSDQKAGGYTPKLDDVIDIFWNRWGKLDGIKLVK